MSINQLTEEELVLSIGKAVLAKRSEDLTVDEIVDTLLSSYDASVPAVLSSFIRREFIRQSKNLARCLVKTYIATSLQNGSSEFIQDYISASNDAEKMAVFPSHIAIRLDKLKEANALGSLLVECDRTFNRLREKFAPAKSEDQLRHFLSEWLRGGLMPLDVRKSFKAWKRKGCKLTELREMLKERSRSTDTCDVTNWRELKRLLQPINTDNFVEAKKLATIMDILLADPQIFIEGGHHRHDCRRVRVIGPVVFLSEVRQKIEKMLQNEATTQVDIFAEYSLGIDCDLVDSVWRGKNLVVVTQCAHVWPQRLQSMTKIVLSGKSFDVEAKTRRKAANSKSLDLNGSDGQDGRAGESSGNLVILATKFLKASRLCVELDGGRGEDGEDGGDGCDGINGLGVTQEDLNNTVVKYTSLYRNFWSNFDDYSPPSGWTVETNYGSSGDYIFRTYRDRQNRVMTYSFAADKGWTYSTFELYLLIQGSNGRNGTAGGQNGVGGQGGYNGKI